MSSRGLLCAAAVIAAAAAFPTAASAASCGGTFHYDLEGYEWDITAPEAVYPFFGTFDDGGSKAPTGTPPGPRTINDSYDSWGALFVGGQAPTNLYGATTDGNGCFDEELGRERVFPKQTLDGLEVQRKVYVSETGLPGARILNLVRNPGGSPRETSVQVGDTVDGDGAYSGDLGSDDDTRVRSSSSGDAALTAADRWAVTSDHSPGGTNNDLALAHVLDGRGGSDRVDFAALVGDDDLGWRWEDVLLPAGGTVAYLSYEIQQGVAGADGAAEDEAARRKALAYDAAPLAQVYAGMTDQEIAAVRNWPKPAPTIAFTSSAGATDRAPVAFSAAGSSASSVPGSCAGLSYAWDFGDGATAAGAAASHRFAAGTHTVNVTATNSCGGQATKAETVTVADATAPAATLKAPRSARLKRLAVRLQSSEGGTATVTAKVGKWRIAKARAALQAGQVRTVRLKVGRRAAASLAGKRRVKVALAVRVTDAAGNVTALSRRIQARP